MPAPALVLFPLALSLIGPQDVVPEIPTVYPRHVQIVAFERTGTDGATGTYAVAERRAAPLETDDPHEDVRQERIDVFRLETGEWLETITREIRVDEAARTGDQRPWIVVERPKGLALIAIGPLGKPDIKDVAAHDHWGGGAAMSRVFDAVTNQRGDAKEFRFAALLQDGDSFGMLSLEGAPAHSMSSSKGGNAPLAAAFVRDGEGPRFVGQGFQYVKLAQRRDSYSLSVETIGNFSANKSLSVPADLRLDADAPIQCCALATGESLFTALAQAARGDTPALLALVELTGAGESEAHFVGRPTGVDGTPLDCGHTLGLVPDIDGDGVPDILTSAPDAEPAVPLIAVSGATGAVLATFAGEPGERIGFSLSDSPDGSVVVVLGERPVAGAEPVRTLHVLLVPTPDAPTFRPLGG